MALLVLIQSPAFTDDEDQNMEVDIITPLLTEDFAEEDLMDIYPGGPTVSGLQLRLIMQENVFIEGEPIPFEVTYRNGSVAKIGLIGYRINEKDAATNTFQKVELRRSETIVHHAKGKRLQKTQDLSWHGHVTGSEELKRFVSFIKPSASFKENGDLIQ